MVSKLNASIQMCLLFTGKLVQFNILKVYVSFYQPHFLLIASLSESTISTRIEIEHSVLLICEWSILKDDFQILCD